MTVPWGTPQFICSDSVSALRGQIKLFVLL